MIKSTYLPTLAKEVVEQYIKTVINDALAGRESLNHYTESQLFQNSLRKLVEVHWNDIIDVSENPYWIQAVVTSADRELLIRRILTDIKPLLQQPFEQALLQNSVPFTSDVALQLLGFQQNVESIISQPENMTTFHIQELLNKLLALNKSLMAVEKTRIILKSYGLEAPKIDITHPQESQINPLDAQNTHENESAAAIEEVIEKAIERDVSTSYTPKTPKITYFKRSKLFGGSIVDETDKLIRNLPESIVRKLDLTHGDQLQFTDHPDPRKHDIKIIQKTGKDNPKRVFLMYCLLSKSEESNEIYLSSQLIGGEKKIIQIAGFSGPINIRPEDIIYHQLEDKDLVDVAYWENRPDTIRIVWKHKNA